MDSSTTFEHTRAVPRGAPAEERKPIRFEIHESRWAQAAKLHRDEKGRRESRRRANAQNNVSLGSFFHCEDAQEAFALIEAVMPAGLVLASEQGPSGWRLNIVLKREGYFVTPTEIWKAASGGSFHSKWKLRPPEVLTPEAAIMRVRIYRRDPEITEHEVVSWIQDTLDDWSQDICSKLGGCCCK